MLYTLLAFYFFSHINNTPKPDSVQEPGFVFLGLPLSETAPIFCRGAEFTAVSKAHDNVRLHGTICTKVVGASIVVVSKGSAHLEKQICRYNS